MSEGLCASSWTGTAAHSLCARLLEEVTVCYLPQTRCACGVHVYPANFKLDQLGK